MGVYAGLLRGINVSGHNKIRMTDLKAALYTLGFENLSTYIQSGNLIFESDISSATDLEKLIEDKIRTVFELDIRCLVHTKKEFQYYFEQTPFQQDEIDTKMLYYIHLEKEADPDLFEEMVNNEDCEEEMRLKGKLIYVYYPKGYGRSKLVNNFFERKLKMKATARNFNTMKNMNDALNIFAH